MTIGLAGQPAVHLTMCESENLNGNLFFVKNWWEITTPGDPKYFALVFPSGATSVRLQYEVGGDTEYAFTVSVNPTITVPGTPIIGRNANGRSAKTHTLGIYEDPTVTADGIVARRERFGASKTVGNARTGYCLTGIPGLTYALKVEKLVVGTHYFDAHLFWIEDTYS